MEMLLQLARQGDPAENVFAVLRAFAEADSAGVGMAELKHQVGTDLKDIRRGGCQRIGKEAQGSPFRFDVGGVGLPEPQLRRDGRLGNRALRNATHPIPLLLLPDAMPNQACRSYRHAFAPDRVDRQRKLCRLGSETTH